MTKKKAHWFKRMFSGKRILRALVFSVLLGVAVWATPHYQSAFAANDWIKAVEVMFFVALLLLIFGGNVLENINT